MLIRTHTFPDEIDRSYLGRLIRLNGKQDKRGLIDLATTWAGLDNDPNNQLSTIEWLSNIAGLELQTFVRQHTTLPLRRGITAYMPDLSHGDDKSRSMLRSSGMRAARTGSYFCVECVDINRKDHGLSYWHRKQQIPGLLWCPTHLIPLSHVEDNKSFILSPATFLQSATTGDMTKISKYKKNKYIQMFLNISSALMDRHKPFHNRNIAYAIKQRATEIKLRNFGGNRNAPLLSDIVIKSFDKHWLEITFPAMNNKKQGLWMSQIDGLSYGKKATPPVTAYILAASTLYDSAEHALQAFSSAKFSEEPKSPTNSNYRVRMDDSKLSELYIHHCGNHAVVATAIKRNLPSVTSRLSSLGLPNLADRNGVNLAFITSFLIEGKSLSDSMAISGINQQTMERVLRILGCSLSKVLKEMMKQS